MSEVALVFTYALITALATGLGALPFLFLRELSPRVVAYANALAAGLMMGASFGLVAEGTEYGSAQTVAGGVLGVLFILGTQHWLAGREIEFGGRQGAGARQMVLMVVVMTVHSFSEGVAVGVSFGGGVALATVITVAIAVHNIPEGLAPEVCTTQNHFLLSGISRCAPGELQALSCTAKPWMPREDRAAPG